jgi:hypothetical protein
MKGIKKLLITIALLYSGLFASLNTHAQSLVINEIMASNAFTMADEDGDFEDWIELYNGSGQPINLLGYMVTDNLSNPGKWTFPDITIAPGDHLLLFASGKDRLQGPYLHTNFSLRAAGEDVVLSNPEWLVIDHYMPVELTTDNAYGRLTDGADSLVFFAGATPGESNDGQALLEAFPDSLLFSHVQGFYADTFYLQVNSNLEQAVIHYTTDGSDPTTASAILPDSLLIYNRENDENYFSLVRTNPITAPEFYRWHPPQGNIFKGTSLKVRSFIENEAVSPIYTQTYLVHPEMDSLYGLPVASIVTDSLNLFDYETGIYLAGLHHDLNPSWAWVWGTGNYHQRGDEWERPANMSFFEADGSLAFQQDVGLRIHGDGSRALPQKSLRVYARNVYGKGTIDYAFFPETGVESYQRILLRNAGQDFYTTMLTDALTHRLVEHLDVETQSVRPAVVFVNGEFWGIHHIRDRIDKYYFEYCCGADPDQLDYLEGAGIVKEGSNADYLAMKVFIADNDLQDDENYLQVAEQIDIANYIDYTIAKQYIAAFDWPGNNMEFWRKHEAGGKWRWVYFDNDQSMIDFAFDAIAHSTLEGGPEWPNPDWSTFLFRNLIRNDQFKQQYLDRFEYHFYHTFSEERINKELDSLLQQIEPIMERQIHRWNYPANYNHWVYRIYLHRAFAMKRPCHMLYHLINHFDITDTTYAAGVCDTIHAVNVPERLFTDQDFILWPNPASSHIQLRLKYPITTVSKIMVFDVYGRKAKDVELPQTPYIRNILIPINDLASGTYVMRIYTEGSMMHKKFIINR